MSEMDLSAEIVPEDFMEQMCKRLREKNVKVMAIFGVRMTGPKRGHIAGVWRPVSEADMRRIASEIVNCLKDWPPQ